MARAKRRKVQERRMEKDRKTGVARREGMNGKREKARNVWRFGVMRFNYKTRRVLQLARRRTPHPSPTPAPRPRGTNPRLSRPFSFPPFRGYLRFDSPYLPSHPQLCRSFSRVPRLGPYPENYPLPRTVKDSRTERPRTPASHLLLAAAVSGDGGLDILPIRLAKFTEIFLPFRATL